MKSYQEFVEGNRDIKKTEWFLFLEPTEDLKEIEFWKKRLGDNYALYYKQSWRYGDCVQGVKKMYYLYSRQ
jgi:hypothetical protein